MVGTETLNKTTSDKYKIGRRRILAAILDAIIVSLPFFAITSNASNFENYTLIYWSSLIYPFFQIFYFIFCHYYWGQTLGKAALNIKVVDLTESKGLTFKQSFLREIVWVFVEIIGLALFTLEFSIDLSNTSIETIADFTKSFSTYWLIIEMFTMFFNKKRRAIHDFLAGTVVIREEKISVANNG